MQSKQSSLHSMKPKRVSFPLPSGLCSIGRLLPKITASYCTLTITLFRRHADRTGTLWFQRLKDSGSNKRLNLIYLANEVAQQSKARKKDDFLVAFAPIIAEATAVAYRGATNEVQTKLRRVVEVWRARQIFETPIQEAVESRIEGQLSLSSTRDNLEKCCYYTLTWLQSSTNHAPHPKSLH